MREPHDIIETASLTEKSTLLGEKQNKYVFRVSPRANKTQIKDAVQRLFQKKVIDVNTCNYAGKQKRVRGPLGTSPALEKSDRDFGRRRKNRAGVIYGPQELSPPHSSSAF